MVYVHNGVMKKPFWEAKSLEQMTETEWESLCDGCAKCCLLKFEDEDSQEILTTNVSCRYLGIETCRCGDYKNRKKLVPRCYVLTPDNLSEIVRWFPDSCAYRLLYEKKKLPDWHPLVSGDANSVHESGASVMPYAQSEEYIHPDQIFEHIIDE